MILIDLSLGLGLSLVVAFVVFALCQLGWKRLEVVLKWGIWVMRLRYCLLLCAAPGLLGVIAFKFPHMLQALLLVRNDSTFFDVFNMTMVSFFTAGVGMALCSLVGLNGPQRFAKAADLLSTNGMPADAGITELPPAANDVQSISTSSPLSISQSHSPSHHSGTSEHVHSHANPLPPLRKRGWTLFGVGLWWILGSIFPGFVCFMSQHDLANSREALILGWITGLVAANVVAFFVAMLERWLLGHIDGTAKSGILPYEDYVRWLTPWQIGDWKVPGHQIATWLFGDANGGFSWLLRGRGYTHFRTGILLPGQAQALILVGFSAAIYLFWYSWGVTDNTWSHLGWPSGFYAVLLLFLVGFFMSGLAFWLDRYGLPPVVFAVLYTLSVFYFNAVDHHFDIAVAPASARKSQAADGLTEADAAKTYVAASIESPTGKLPYEQLYWADVMKNWPFPRINGKRTLVVVTASGGGIQAAAWTAKVLSKLDAEFPGFSQSIGLISAVSGGSVGTMFYLGHRELLDADDANPSPVKMLDQPALDRIEHDAEQSSLEAVSWGLVFPDFVRTVVPLAAPQFRDRGWALESWWWNSMGGGQQTRKLMSAVTIRDLIPLIAAHRLPPMIFNATCVETGQRVLISPLHVAAAKPDPSRPDDLRPERETLAVDQSERPQELVAAPIDFLDFYDAALAGDKTDTAAYQNRANVLVSTAVRLSATFSYVTPVARPRRKGDFGFLKSLNQAVARPDENGLAHRLNYHFCDGGYADNPGLVTAVRALHDLLQYYRRNGSKAPFEKPPFDEVLIVRIEPFPKSAAQHAKDNTGFLSAVYGPTNAVNAMRVSTQAERGELELRLLQESINDRLQTSQPFQLGIAELEQLHQKLPKGQPATQAIESVVASARDRGYFLGNEGNSKWRRAVSPDPDTLTEVANAVSDIKVTVEHQQQLSLAQSHMRRALEMANDPESKSRNRNSIVVRSVTFRFETYASDRPEGADRSDLPPASVPPVAEKDQEPIEPPLTWTLTEEQKNDLDRAWKRIRETNKWTTRDGSTADNLSPQLMHRYFPTKPKMAEAR
jgi:hypothetical protein